MNDGFLTREWLFSIKAATRDLVKRAGGYERAADLVNHGKSTVHRWGSPDASDVIPLVAALILQRETGSALVTEAMAAIGGLKIAVPEGGQSGDCLYSTFAGVTQANAQFSGSFADAMRDGKLSPNEIEQMRRDLVHLNESARAMQDALARNGVAIGGGA